MVDMNAVLEKAAASPDPAVRNTAIRYRKLQDELNSYEAFFTAYGTAQSVMQREPAAAAGASTKTTAAVSGQRRRGRKTSAETDDFFLRVRNVLIEARTPLRMKNLYEVFYQRNPEQDKISEETFRQRLYKKRDRIPFHEGRGYWPVDLELPAVQDHQEQQDADLAA